MGYLRDMVGWQGGLCQEREAGPGVASVLPGGPEHYIHDPKATRKAHF